MRRALLLLVIPLASGCYLSHGAAPTEGRFGVFTFATCTGSGLFTMIAVCADGSASVRQGAVGRNGRVDTAGWSALDDERIQVLAVRGGLWDLRWDGETWRDEAPIDGCAARALRAEELEPPLRALAEEMACR